MFELNQYKGKKVFITGHTGFKGTWLLAILHNLGAIIKGYALAPENENCIFNAIQAHDFCSQSIIQDIRDKDNLKKEIIEFEPDYIFHLAAQPLVRLSYEIPNETFEVNVLGTGYLLDAVRQLKHKCNIVIITTDKVYKNKETDIAYYEADELGGYDPYSASKACTELLVASYRNSFFNRAIYSQHQKAIVTARAGNVIGGGDYSKDRIIPDLVRAFQNNQTLSIRNPNAIRPWQHVLEPLIGYLKLGLLLDKAYQNTKDAYNFGPNAADHLSVESLIQIGIQIFGKGAYEIIKMDDLHEAGILKLNIELAQNHLQWQPVYNASTAIKKTIEWYVEKGDKKAFTLMQIEAYLKNIYAL
jgi:CDP-glucose 4,6-dehydratase